VTDPAPAELRALRARTKAEAEASRAQVRAALAEEYRAEAWWAGERQKAREATDAAITAALVAGGPQATVRAICRSLNVGQHRVVRIRAQLARRNGLGPRSEVRRS
jgi:phosphoserine phosphatase